MRNVPATAVLRRLYLPRHFISIRVGRNILPCVTCKMTTFHTKSSRTVSFTRTPGRSKLRSIIFIFCPLECIGFTMPPCISSTKFHQSSLSDTNAENGILAVQSVKQCYSLVFFVVFFHKVANHL